MKVVKKIYDLKDDTSQRKDSLNYWKNQSIEKKLEVLESLREDAIKLGLYPDYNEKEPRLQRVYKVTERS